MKNPIKLTVTALLAGLVLSGASLTSTGCSSNPAFCADRDQLEQSVSDLSKIQLNSDAGTALQQQIQVIETQANQTVDAARQDFPEESDAVESSLAEVTKSIEGLPDSPSASDLLPTFGKVAQLVQAVSQFKDATDSACD